MFSTYPFILLLLFFNEYKKGNNIIYNHFRYAVFRLPPQTWHFFTWFILVGSVKGFASKSINLIAPLVYICLIIYGPAKFCLNFPFVSWTEARISFSTKSPNLKSLALTFLSKAFTLQWYVSFDNIQCDTRPWVSSHPSCIIDHIYFVTNLLRGFHSPVLFSMNGHPFQ